MEGKLSDIAKILSQKHYDNIHKPALYGLLNGSMGEILFLYYYSLIDKKYSSVADELLERLVVNVMNNEKYPAHYSYCSGLAGLAYGLYVLEDSGFIQNSEDAFDDIDHILIDRLDYEFANNHYDFLHGALGIGFYFLRHYRYQPKVCESQLTRIVSFLKGAAEINIENNTARWVKKDLIINRNTYNISLSHGGSSIVVFLSQIILSGMVSDTTTKVLLEQAVNFIISQQWDSNRHGSFFPTLSLIDQKEITNQQRSRLSWCYGDLGIALALKYAATALDRRDWFDFSTEIMLFSANRLDKKLNNVFDAQICHGTAGIGQIFYRYYLETKTKEFYTAYEYWKKETMDMAYHKDGYAGFKFYNGAKHTWENSTSLLEGLAGIGLFLLSEISPDWDEILLLSFPYQNYKI